MSGPAQSQSLSDHFLWSLDGKPVSVLLNLGVVERLQPLFLPGPGGRTPEIGGFLLGNVREEDGSFIVTIDNFELLKRDESTADSWHLSPGEKKDFQNRLRRLLRYESRGIRPVGWFRTHTRRGLYLDQNDFSLFRDFFPELSSIALLIQPEAPEPRASFFFWEDGDIHRSKPYAEFSFTPDSLRRMPTAKPAPEIVAPPAAPGPTPAAAAVPARVVPIRPALVAQLQPAVRPFRTWHVSVSRQWRKAALAVPVIIGIVFGLFWNPTPLRKAERVHIPRSTGGEPQQRAVFEPPPLAAAPETGTYTPPPEEVVEERTRVQPPVPRVVRNLVIPKRHVAAPEPVMDAQAPSVAAVPRFEGLPPVALRTPPRAIVTLEPVRVSTLRRAVGAIPGFGFLKRKKSSETDEYIPARVIREIRPVSPPVTSEVAVNVRLTVGPDGYVQRAELMSHRVDSTLAEAAINAAKQWRFKPATVDEKPVPAEMVLRFRFGAASDSGT